MKIIDFNSYKNCVNKLDQMAQVDMTKPNTVFPQKKDDSIEEKMQRLLDIADGKNPSRLDLID